MPESAAAMPPATTTTAPATAPSAPPPPAEPSGAVTSRLDSGHWIAAAASLLVLLIVAGILVWNRFTLPDCNAESIQTTLNAIFEEKKVALAQLSDVKAVAATRSERTCAAQAEIPGGMLNIDYRIDWSGWRERVTITRAEAEARIDQAQLEEVKAAADEFISLAKDSPTTGKPPRQTEPTIAVLLNKVFNLSEIEGTTLAIADIPKANEWFFAGDRVGTVYILPGTCVGDINKLPADSAIQRRIHRNVAEFAAEFARYLDFQIKLAAIMMEAELGRSAKAADTLERPEVKREIAEVRTTLTDSMTGDLTTLAYDGVTDHWRRERLAVLMQVAPKAAAFLTPDQARSLRDHAQTVTSFVRDKGVQDSLKAFADTFAAK